MMSKTFWAGFSDGKICLSDIDDGWGGFVGPHRKSPMIFSSKKAARKQFQDVRKIKITVVK